MKAWEVPVFHLVPVTFEAKNVALVDVAQEEWHYQKGNDSTNITMEECLPWESISKKAKDCSTKCLPVVFQHLWEDKNDRLRCHNKSDHFCMVQTIEQQVCNISIIKFMLWPGQPVAR